MKIIRLSFFLLCFLSCQNDFPKEREINLEERLNISIEQICNCEDSNFVIKQKRYIDTINLIQSNIINFVSQSKLDHERKAGILNSLKQNDSLYKLSYSQEAELIFWSYGSASMTGERLLYSNCYYLNLLRNRVSLLKFARQKLEGSIVE